MAKTIKFNLVLDGYPVRTIEELQEHFSIEDMLRYYENGLLQKWLSARDYQEELKAVKSFKQNSHRNLIAKGLIHIFKIPASTDDIDETLTILSYLEQQKKREAQYVANAKKTRDIINDYFSNYNALIKHMEENEDNMGVLRADAIELERMYFPIFIKNHRALYFRLKENAPKMIYVLLTHERFQPYLIGVDAPNDVQESLRKTFSAYAQIKNILGKNVRFFNRNTQGNWDPVQPKRVKIMVLHIHAQASVRNADKRDEKLNQSEINGQFRLLNGADIQTNGNDQEMLYMEV